MNAIALIPIGELHDMASAMARAKLFGQQTPEQLLSLMLIAQANGQHPAAAARDYDVIKGRPSKKAEAMLRDFLLAGGKVEWHAYTDAKCDATFSHPSGGSVRVDWDMVRVKKARISNEEMYSKYPRNMLRARCISEGVRTVFPVATGGMLAPEEAQALHERPETPPELLPSDELLTAARAAADAGRESFAAWWKAAPPADRRALQHELDDLRQRTERAHVKAEAIEATPVDDPFVRDMEAAEAQQ